MADEVIPASPDQFGVPLRDSDRRNRSKLNRKLRRPRRLQPANTKSADNNLSGRGHNHVQNYLPEPEPLAHESGMTSLENDVMPGSSSQQTDESIAGATPLTRDLAYASARLYALGDTLAPNRWENKPQPELKFQTLNDLMSQTPNAEEADLFEDLVTAVEKENWLTQLTQAPGYKTPPPALEPTIDHFRTSSRCSMALSSTENTPERLSQLATDSDAEDVLEQTMRGIVDENDEAGLAVRSQQFSLLSQSFEMIETAKWPSKIESAKFSAFSIHEDMDRMPLSAEKRKSTDEPECEKPPKKLHLEVPPHSPSAFDCDELFDDEFTQVKRPEEGALPAAPEVSASVASFVGFSKAGGGRIQQTGIDFNKTGSKQYRKNIFEGIDEEVQSLFGGAATKELVPFSDASDEVFQGFQPVSRVFSAGTPPRMKEASLLEPVQKPQIAFEISGNSVNNPTSTVGLGGFAMASGSVPKVQTKPKRDIFAGIDEEVQNLFGVIATNTLLPLTEGSEEVFQGFQAVSKVFGADAIVKLKANSLKAGDAAITNPVQKPQSAFSPCNDIGSSSVQPSPIGFGGFSLASGNVLHSKPILLKKDIFAGIDDEIENDFKLGFYDKQTFVKRVASHPANTPANKRFHSTSTDIASTSTAKTLPPSPLGTPASKLWVSGVNPVSPSPVLGSQNRRFSTPNKPSLIGFNMAAHLLNDRSSTPISKPMTLTQEESTCKAVFLQDEAISLGRSLEDEEFLAAFAGHDPPSAIAAPPPSSPRRNKNLRQTKLLHRFETADDETVEDEIVEINDSLVEDMIALTEQASRLNDKRPVLTEVVAAGRRRAFLAQSEAIKMKPESEKSRKPGSLYITKHGNLDHRQSLKDFFGGSLPQVVKSESRLFAKLSKVSAATAETFKFDMEDYYSPEICSANIDGVGLADDATLIFNEQSQAGVVEVKSAFLCQPGVNPSLVPSGWVENAFKWIIVKLAAFELWITSRGGSLTQCLNPDTVLQQLKYRYDREIDLVQRPAVRKIFELDDSPAKPMVLFVAQVFETDIELSDGWYGIRTKVDTPLRHFVKSGRIKVGAKLMMQNAELVGAEDTGCSPLDAPAHVRLSINANSTRVASWDSKLGFCPHPQPLRIPLDSVLENGGVVAEAIACIIRVYPMMYVDKSGKSANGSTVLRSEKLQLRHNLQVDTNRLAIIEETYHQIQKDIDTEDKIRLKHFRDKRKSLPARLTDIKDADDLSDLLEFSNDPAAIEAELTCTQKKLVMDHQAAAKAHRDADIADRVRAKLEVAYGMERQVSPLLKLRICDARTPNKNMMLSIWRPSDENRAMLKEGGFLKMSNVSANAMRYNVAQLTAGSMSKFEIVDSEQFVRRPEMQRQLTSLAVIASGGFTPFANEFDVVGVVVKIGEMSKFQLVYLADMDMNLLIVNFWGGIKQFAYDDTVLMRRILCASNVQWRPSDTSLHGVPKSYATECTTFMQRPANDEATRAITELTTALSSVSIDDFVKKCVEKIEEAERKVPLRNSSLLNRTPTPLSSTSANQLDNVTSREFSPGQPKPSVRERIEFFNRIPSPPRVPTFELTWNNNYRRRKVSTRRTANENL